MDFQWEVPVTQRKLKSKKERERTIEQFCSVCKKTFDMSVVEEAENQDVIWLNCPGCRGYLPHMLNQEDVAEAKDIFAANTDRAAQMKKILSEARDRGYTRPDAGK